MKPREREKKGVEKRQTMGGGGEKKGMGRNLGGPQGGVRGRSLEA